MQGNKGKIGKFPLNRKMRGPNLFISKNARKRSKTLQNAIKTTKTMIITVIQERTTPNKPRAPNSSFAFNDGFNAPRFPAATVFLSCSRSQASSSSFSSSFEALSMSQSVFLLLSRPIFEKWEKINQNENRMEILKIQEKIRKIYHKPEILEDKCHFTDIRG